MILERVEAIDPDQVDATAAELHAIVDRWQQRAETAPGLVYHSFAGTQSALMTAAAPDAENREELPTMWSLRDVDVESNLYFMPKRR